MRAVVPKFSHTFSVNLAAVCGLELAGELGTNLQRVNVSAKYKFERIRSGTDPIERRENKEPP